ncbi:hypothetical protein PVAP13_8NG091001 [Panicum virgatum]|uniref:Uncharacterized protein n=1 Tax=Panicum virgatum TaxID=38727 RepID=A0A8T0P4B9_PANVG|nr:hypothetical protein PVAP13_8NG091001 [Panicum virgatum]KAG2556622.1 hypothetical protein PVAP13_8NG091001 [Panicum virgatum]KAG2556623.1 hypothetical protein PVAP13_8NG091001 [Panicum virgatum]
MTLPHPSGHSTASRKGNDEDILVICNAIYNQAALNAAPKSPSRPKPYRADAAAPPPQILDRRSAIPSAATIPQPPSVPLRRPAAMMSPKKRGRKPVKRPRMEKQVSRGIYDA